jgi:hypothetical protein
MNNTVVSLVRVFLILIALAVSAFGQAGGDEAFAVEDLATAALMTSAGSIGVINTAPPCFASKVRNRCWINVSTTCGSGWVGLQNSKSIENIAMLITDPPATAGGTDIYPSATPLIALMCRLRICVNTYQSSSLAALSQNSDIGVGHSQYRKR